MTSLATVQDVTDRLGRPLTPAETTRVEGLLPEASALVVAYVGWDPAERPTVPEPVAIAVSRMVARVIVRDADAQFAGADSGSVTAGPFSKQLTFSSGQNSGGPWLAATDKATLRPYRRGTATALAVESDWSGRYRTVTS